jgi:hypothetical protein
VKKSTVGFMLALAVMLTSCSGNGSEKSEKTVENSETVNAGGEIGYFFDSVSFESECAVLAENNRLEIYDYNSKQTCYLCSKPDCKQKATSHKDRLRLCCTSACIFSVILHYSSLKYESIPASS